MGGAADHHAVYFSELTYLNQSYPDIVVDLTVGANNFCVFAAKPYAQYKREHSGEAYYVSHGVETARIGPDCSTSNPNRIHDCMAVKYRACEALRRGNRGSYDATKYNCECFANYLLYNVWESREAGHYSFMRLEWWGGKSTTIQFRN